MPLDFLDLSLGLCRSSLGGTVLLSSCTEEEDDDELVDVLGYKVDGAAALETTGSREGDGSEAMLFCVAAGFILMSR